MTTSPTFTIVAFSSVPCSSSSGRPAAPLLGPEESVECGQDVGPHEQVLRLDGARVDRPPVVRAPLDARTVDEERVAAEREDIQIRKIGSIMRFVKQRGQSGQIVGWVA